MSERTSQQKLLTKILPWYLSSLRHTWRIMFLYSNTISLKKMFFITSNANGMADVIVVESVGTTNNVGMIVEKAHAVFRTTY